jgi:hypothetical protein
MIIYWRKISKIYIQKDVRHPCIYLKKEKMIVIHKRMLFVNKSKNKDDFEKEKEKK